MPNPRHIPGAWRPGRRAWAGLLLAAATAVSFPVAAQDRSAPPPKLPIADRFRLAQETVTKLSDHVYMIRSDIGSNMTVLAGDDGVLVIDDQFAQMRDKVVAAVRSISAKPVRFVVNTHWHGDHAGVNAAFGEQGALVVGQELVRKNMSADQRDAVTGAITPAYPAAAVPKLTFRDGLTLYFDGETVELTHIADAHTEGDTIIYMRGANVLASGDIFSNHFYPGYDVAHGGNIDGVIAAQTRLLTLVDDRTRIVPGHGPLATRDDIRASRDMLIQIRDRVKALIRDGKSEAEVIAAAPTADFDKSWRIGGIDVDRFLKEIYADLKKRGG